MFKFVNAYGLTSKILASLIVILIILIYIYTNHITNKKSYIWFSVWNKLLLVSCIYSFTAIL